MLALAEVVLWRPAMVMPPELGSCGEYALAAGVDEVVDDLGREDMTAPRVVVADGMSYFGPGVELAAGSLWRDPIE